MIDRFFLDESFEKKEVSLTGPEFKHFRVMRMEIGELATLVNGKNQIAKAKILEIKKDRALLSIKSIETKKEDTREVTLSLSLTKQSNLELAIEKGTEIGVHHFWLYPSHKSERTKISPNHQERLRLITISAMKQCGRLDLPTIEIFSKMKELPSFSGTIYFGDVRKNAPSFQKGKENVLMFVGPEKGFDKNEHHYLSKNLKAHGICLGKHILRAETAAISAATLLFS